jgi:hypothetical protein
VEVEVELKGRGGCSSGAVGLEVPDRECLPIYAAEEQGLPELG